MWRAEAQVNGQWTMRAECASKFVAALSLTRDQLYASRQTRLTEIGEPEMSMRTITTAVIDCDNPCCGERYADTADQTAERIERFATRDGWTYDNDTDEHFCPEHSVERAKLLTVAT